MRNLDPQTLSELLEILSPFFQNEDARRAILWMAFGHDSWILHKVKWEGHVETFIMRLASLLNEFADTDPDIPYIWNLLLSVREQAKPDVQQRIDGLRSLFNTSAQELKSNQQSKIGQTLPRHIRVFLSMPDDVFDERALALQVLNQLPYDPLIRGQVTIEIVTQDGSGSFVPNLVPFQDPFEQDHLGPSECDIVIIVLWSHMGTLVQRADTSSGEINDRFIIKDIFNDALEAANNDNLPYLLVYRRTEPMLLELSNPSLLEKYKQWQTVDHFFEDFNNSDGSIKYGLNTYKSPDEFRSKFETHLRDLIRRLLRPQKLSRQSSFKKMPCLNTHDQIMSQPQWEGSPFPGLRPFRPQESKVFFGRGSEIDEVLSRLRKSVSPFISIVGASGSGKSSLVWGGVIPRLTNNAIEGSSTWYIIRFTPDELGTGDPFVSLAAAIMKGLNIHEKNLPDRLRSQPMLLHDLLIEHVGRNNEKQGILIFIDQFEEIFTLVDPAWRKSFVDTIAMALDFEQLRIITTLRADFYSQCVEYPKLIELLRSGSYPLGSPSLASLYQMIARPAAYAGLEFEPGLVERILDETGTGLGSLALMAYTLDELYRIGSPNTKLSYVAYESLGGVQGAIGTKAAEVFQSLDEEAQQTLPQIFRQLVSVNSDGIATRQRAVLSQVIENIAPRKRFVDKFTDSRLLVQTNGEYDEPILEVAHEALLNSWPILRNWIEKTKEDLRLLKEVQYATKEWVRNDENKAYYWPHERLINVAQMIKRLSLDTETDLCDDVQRFIRPEAARLYEEVMDVNTTHFRRATISDRLAEIGDNRTGIGLTSKGLPDVIWCTVPGGQVKLEDNPGTFHISPFQISKFPITYSQYLSFINSPDGYQNAEWWSKIPKQTQYPLQYRKLPNHPVENVSWFDAIAFCRWMSEKCGVEITLPTEYEWQQAATGGNARNVFTWGDKWDIRFANTYESGLGRTTAVGMYPFAASPIGAEDMLGNIWEWCLNKPNDPDDITIEDSEQRAVRGGCWYHDARFSYTGFRNTSWDYAHPRSHLRGFRVVRHDVSKT